jgi:hypothetical protein
MIGTRSKFAALAVGLVAQTRAGCSAGDEHVAATGSATCTATTRPAIGADVSFQQDVLPIFQTSCSFVSCHGSRGHNGIYLGPSGTASDPSAIRAELLQTAEVASMPFVAPGEPDRSWLLRKLEGNYCGVACAGGDCGARMPQNGEPLAPAALTTIATWIAKGAPDN